MFFPLAGTVVSVVLNGSLVYGYNPARLRDGHVVAPIVPFVSGVTTRLEYREREMLVFRGSRVARVAIVRNAPGDLQNAYVPLAPVMEELGILVRFDNRRKVLDLVAPALGRELATPVPFDPRAPQAVRTQIFTPEPVPTPRPTVSGAPRPRRTPLTITAPP